METRKPKMTDEMKDFLHEGLRNYAPALLAMSEFRRQVGSRLQGVLDDSSTQFASLGLSVVDWKLAGVKLDDANLNQNSSWIGLRKTHSAELYSGCGVEWDLDEPKTEQVWTEIWVSAGRTRADRDRLFSSLQKQRSPESKTVLDQYSDGSARLYSYCDPDLFFGFDDTFRSLIEEWAAILSGAGGIQPYLSNSSATLIQQDKN